MLEHRRPAGYSASAAPGGSRGAGQPGQPGGALDRPAGSVAMAVPPGGSCPASRPIGQMDIADRSPGTSVTTQVQRAPLPSWPSSTPYPPSNGATPSAAAGDYNIADIA